MTIRQENKSIYWAWKSMKQRCQNPRCAAFSNYGARGITICDEWQTFEPFFEWCTNNGYKKGLDLDRIDNNKGYCPENCQWTTRKKNINNRRKTLYFTVNEETKTRTEWEEALSIPYGTIKTWFKCHDKEYVEYRLSEIILNGYKQKDYAYAHRKQVKHVETGLVFNCLQDAADYFNVTKAIVGNYARNGRTGKYGTFTYNV